MKKIIYREYVLKIAASLYLLIFSAQHSFAKTPEQTADQAQKAIYSMFPSYYKPQISPFITAVNEYFILGDGVKHPFSFLLAGPDQTLKLALAQVAAQELGLPFVYVHLDDGQKALTDLLTKVDKLNAMKKKALFFVDGFDFNVNNKVTFETVYTLLQALQDESITISMKNSKTNEIQEKMISLKGSMIVLSTNHGAFKSRKNTIGFHQKGDEFKLEDLDSMLKGVDNDVLSLGIRFGENRKELLTGQFTGATYVDIMDRTSVRKFMSVTFNPSAKNFTARWLIQKIETLKTENGNKSKPPNYDQILQDITTYFDKLVFSGTDLFIEKMIQENYGRENSKSKDTFISATDLKQKLTSYYLNLLEKAFENPETRAEIKKLITIPETEELNFIRLKFFNLQKGNAVSFSFDVRTKPKCGEAFDG